MIGGKIATGSSESGIAMGSDTTSDAPIVVKPKLAHRLVEVQTARSTMERLKAFKGFSPSELVPVAPSTSEPRTGLSMGQHTELMAQEWKIAREDQDRLAFESHKKAAEAYRTRLPGRPDRAVRRRVPRQQPARGHQPGAAGATQARLRQGARHADRRQLDAAHRRRGRGAAGLRGMGGEPRPAGAGLPDLFADLGAGVRGGRGAADGADHRGVEDARSRRAQAAGFRLLRDPRGVRGAGAGDAEGVRGSRTTA